MKLSTILDHIDNGHMALPEFQRGYVWNREQVRGLMSSLYRGYPVGGFLVWATETDSASARGDGQLAPGVVKLLLDGQQRVTTLYGIIRGEPPKFFDGNASAFTGLRFHVLDEQFEFYAPTRMKDDPLWIDVTELMQHNIEPFIPRMSAHEQAKERFSEVITRLSRLHGVTDREFHIEEVTGVDKDVDVVVDIFNRVNSGGTKLSKGDLALARICAAWPDARDELRGRLRKWKDHGYRFSMDWYLRNITTILTGSSFFSGLRATSTSDFRDGMQRGEQAIDTMLNLVAARLGLDHDRVLGGRYAFAVTSAYIDGKDEALTPQEQGKLLYWYVHSMLWGRYAGSTESNLNQDLQALHEDGLDGLIGRLRLWRGDLTIRPEDFSGWSIGARFYPMLYLMTRTRSAKDLGTGLPLSAGMLGKLSRLEVHHIHPKALLYEHDYARPQVNAIANYCFLSQDTNLKIGKRSPAEYLAEVNERQPGALDSQWIPNDPELWKPENYPAFLQVRRQLLAKDANALLDEMKRGWTEHLEPVTALPIGDVSPAADHASELDELDRWLEGQGFLPAERDFLVTDPAIGYEVTVVDAAWPTGISGGYTQPVALLLETDEEVEQALGGAGYRFFTNVGGMQEWLIKTSGLEAEVAS